MNRNRKSVNTCAIFKLREKASKRKVVNKKNTVSERHQEKRRKERRRERGTKGGRERERQRHPNNQA